MNKAPFVELLQIRTFFFAGPFGYTKEKANGCDHNVQEERQSKTGVDLIDLLSYASMKRYRGQDWKQDALLSLAGALRRIID